MGKNRQPKKGAIKIVDPKRIDYTYMGENNLINIKSSLDGKKDDDGSKPNIQKDIQRVRYEVTKNAKFRNKGRMTGGQSMQGHSSIYE
jgi:hypothetical protein